MPHRPGTHRLLLSSSCAWLALANFAAAQPQAPQPEAASELPGHIRPQNESWQYAPGKQIRVVYRDPYDELIEEVGGREYASEKRVREGKPPDPERLAFGQYAQISDAEDETMRAILLEVCERLTELSKQIRPEAEELDHHYSDDLAEKRFALLAQIQPILDDVPVKLKTELGDKAFARIVRMAPAYFGKRSSRTVVYWYRRCSPQSFPGEFPFPTQLPGVTHDPY